MSKKSKPISGHGAFRRGEPLPKLLKRAQMDIFAFNTDVVRAMVDPKEKNDDNAPAAMISRGHDMYGDCIMLWTRYPGMERGVWNYMNISPARARILAYHILHRCAMLDEETAMKPIDRPNFPSLLKPGDKPRFKP